MVHEFHASLKRGELGEAELGRCFAQWFVIEPASKDEQQRGIDRHFTERATGKRLRVEYKTDYMAHRTGNAFIETVSVDAASKPGWAYRSEADVLIYFVVHDLLA